MAVESLKAEGAEPRVDTPALSDRTVTWLSVLLVLLGAAGRLVWVLRGHLAFVNTEAAFIAKALAEGRGFSEAFGPGTGPTAHLMPLTPLPAALVYSLLGAGSPGAELALSVWAIAIVSAAMLVGERVLRELGVGPWSRVAAVGAVALAPVQPWLETVSFRTWEGGIAALSVLLMLLALLRLDRRETIGGRTLVGLGLANAFMFVLNPIAAVATSGAIGVFFLRRVPPKRWFAPILVAGLAVAAVLVPWGLRNQAVLGQFVPLRTGEGISMALAYHDGRLAGDLRSADYQRFLEVSPLLGKAPRARYLEVGEVAYNHELTRSAQAWMQAHPDQVWKIRFRNFVEFYAPPAWQWRRFASGSVSAVEARRWFVTGTAIGAALTVAVALFTRRWRWLYVAAILLLPALPYSFTYPLLRYRYLISTLQILVAVAGAAELGGWALRRLRGGGQPA